MDKYLFSSGGFIDIQGIAINPNKSARVQALCFFSENIAQMKFVEITGDEYQAWGNDDDYLISLVGHKLGMGHRVQPWSNDPDYKPEPIKNYNFTITDNIPTTTINDNRSIHNDADISKISILEEQMVEQTRLIQQMKQIMISKGMI
jgi:hypothetical protein